MQKHVDSRRIYSLIEESLNGVKSIQKIRAILVPGKCLRPQFLYLFAKSKYQKASLFYPLGAAIECLHLYTLVHDDVIDQDITRRGIPTLNARFGNEQAIILGDIVRTGVNSLILKSSLSPQEKVYAFSVLTETDKIVNEGQVHQEEVEKNPHQFTEKIWESVVWEKTGILFWAAISLGNPNGNQKIIQTVAKHIGYLLQTKDDIWDFDFHGDAGRAFSDMKHLSLNWLIIEGKKKIPNLISTIKKAKTTREFQAIAQKLQKEGIVEKAEQKAERHKKEIIKRLSELRIKNSETTHIEDLLNHIIAIKTKYKR